MRHSCYDHKRYLVSEGVSSPLLQDIVEQVVSKSAQQPSTSVPTDTFTSLQCPVKIHLFLNHRITIARFPAISEIKDCQDLIHIDLESRDFTSGRRLFSQKDGRNLIQRLSLDTVVRKGSRPIS